MFLLRVPWKVQGAGLKLSFLAIVLLIPLFLHRPTLQR